MSKRTAGKGLRYASQELARIIDTNGREALRVLNSNSETAVLLGGGEAEKGTEVIRKIYGFEPNVVSLTLLRLIAFGETKKLGIKFGHFQHPLLGNVR